MGEHQISIALVDSVCKSTHPTSLLTSLAFETLKFQKNVFWPMPIGLYILVSQTTRKSSNTTFSLQGKGCS